MDSVFPFGFPAPTAWYLTLYVLTFALHQFFMHYVLAGSLYVGWCSLIPGGKPPRAEQPLALVIREWLPFLLSAAITAGVAPLLFVQIVYPRQFYTANLLLSWKWMIVVPVLVVAFYLLYLQKSRVISRWPLAARALVATVPAACFVFVGFCWTANHMVGNVESSWPAIYSSGVLNLNIAHVVLRMLIWIGGSFASLAVFTGWQLRRTHDIPPVDVSRIAIMGLGGVILAFTASVAYLFLIDVEARAALTSVSGAPYLALACFGALLQSLGWWKVNRSKEIKIGPLILTTNGLALAIIGCCVAREVLRLQELDITAIYTRHAEASQIGGLGIFIVFAVVNVCLIGYCIWIVRSNKGQLG